MGAAIGYDIPIVKVVLVTRNVDGDLIAPSGIAPSRAAKTGQNEATANQFGRMDIELEFHVPVGSGRSIMV